MLVLKIDFAKTSLIKEVLQKLILFFIKL